ncbi:MAG: hypothetical protein GXO49_00040 [Chlorobi bacterium]|nr:hypothetical protein [Chlorobiota bacterium]
MTRNHSFHIPVLGIGYTLDTPVKVAQYGINSTISLVDDILLEKLRKVYCEKFEVFYNEISEKIDDFRAKRITSYLNLVNDIAKNKFEELKNVTSEKVKDLKEYLNLLPNSSELKAEFKALTDKHINTDAIKKWVKENLSMGSIDVNIMTKIDKDNYLKGEKLPIEYNDAHAALRGFANSNLESSVIFSAGMNPRLYSYIEQFDDFFPDKNGYIKKKIVLKVSDYRSALIQGKFLAKKGLWVSEFRIESGLNCGGHAFATEGFLLGPILEEFKENRETLNNEVFDILKTSLSEKNKVIPKEVLPLRITAQGGVGTTEEHNFLIDYYGIDSVGWGSPFMLVPEATSIDDETLHKLEKAKEDDIYLSDISPLGVPFNSLKNNTKDIEKLELIKQGRPGSSCPKEYLALNKSDNGKNVCTASIKYQFKKIKELKKENLTKEEYKFRFDKIVEKSCICVGLGTSALKANKLDTQVEGDGISVCPGPNLAYFSKRMSLKEIVGHIYGRVNVIKRTDRPNMYVKELHLYLDYLKNKIQETKDNITKKQVRYLSSFSNNLQAGIEYYQVLFNNLKCKFTDSKQKILNDLQEGMFNLKNMNKQIKEIQESLSL